MGNFKCYYYKTKEGKSPGHNRWFAITLPIFWFYTAPPGEEQKQRAAHLFQLIAGESMPDDSMDGHEQMKNILFDFASSQSDARFGLEALKYLQERNYEQVARLILALQLEHLKEFAFYFRLRPETVADSNMRELVPLLPLRIATILMFLYASSDPQDTIEEMAKQIIDKDFLTKTMAQFKAVEATQQKLVNEAKEKLSQSMETFTETINTEINEFNEIKDSDDIPCLLKDL